MSESETIRILAFGDSLTAGTPGYDRFSKMGDPQSQYGYWLQEFACNDSIPILLDNRGVPGELAVNMLSRIKRILRSQNYDITIIMGGSNDIGWGYSVEQIMESLKSIWAACLDKQTLVFACTIPPIGSFFGTIQHQQRLLNDQIRAIASNSKEMVMADVFQCLANDEGLLPEEYDSGDGLHLSIDGYRRVAECIWNSGLNDVLSQIAMERSEGSF